MMVAAWSWRSAIMWTIRFACSVHVVGRPAANQAKSTRRPMMRHMHHDKGGPGRDLGPRIFDGRMLHASARRHLNADLSFRIFANCQDVLLYHARSHAVLCCWQWTTQCDQSCSSDSSDHEHAALGLAYRHVPQASQVSSD